MIIFLIIIELFIAIFLIKFLTDKTEQIIKIQEHIDLTEFSVQYGKFKRLLQDVKKEYRRKLILENLQYNAKIIANAINIFISIFSAYKTFKIIKKM